MWISQACFPVGPLGHVAVMPNLLDEQTALTMGIFSEEMMYFNVNYTGHALKSITWFIYGIAYAGLALGSGVISVSFGKTKYI